MSPFIRSHRVLVSIHPSIPPAELHAPARAGVNGKFNSTRHAVHLIVEAAVRLSTELTGVCPLLLINTVRKAVNRDNNLHEVLRESPR